MESRTLEERYYYNLQIRSHNPKFAKLVIRGPREGDALQILKLWSNPNNDIQVPDFLPNPSQVETSPVYFPPPQSLNTLESVKTWISNWGNIAADFDGMGPPGSLPLFAFLDDQLIGETSFCNPYTDAIEECARPENSTLSYFWSPGLKLKIDGSDEKNLRRKGYGCECVRMLTDWAFGEFGKRGVYQFEGKREGEGKKWIIEFVTKQVLVETTNENGAVRGMMGRYFGHWQVGRAIYPQWTMDKDLWVSRGGNA
ncbi:hypothetical protein BGZ60DRAFT_524830 [Tricladium varicosporioides]|nr:hypothetical protein BGZ60DRAFT_524830 [Hymenoscyphus varicosporioides]